MKGSDKRWLTTREIVVFAMLGAIMFIGDIIMEWAPNVHPVTMLTVLYTVVYRKKAIVPFVIYIALSAAFFGVIWLVPYCYIFPLVWLCTLLVPQRLSPLWRQVCYSLVCAFFGLAFGALYAPWQALVFMKTFDVSKILAWIVGGLPYDIIHAVGNFAASFLILPLASLLKKIDK